MAPIEALAETLHSVAARGIKPKAIMAAVRERHPKAGKKEVVRSAFYALTEEQETDPVRARDSHSFAFMERAPDEGEPVIAKRRRCKKDRKAVPGDQATHRRVHEHSQA